MEEIKGLKNAITEVEKEISEKETLVTAIQGLEKKLEAVHETERMVCAVKILQEAQAQTKIEKEEAEAAAIAAVIAKKISQDEEVKAEIIVQEKMLETISMCIDDEDRFLQSMSLNENYRAIFTKNSKSKSSSKQPSGGSGSGGNSRPPKKDGDNTFFKQLDDAMHNGKLCKQFVCLDKNGNYSKDSIKSFIPYDTPILSVSGAFQGQCTSASNNKLDPKTIAFIERTDREFDDFVQTSRQKANFGNPEIVQYNLMCARLAQHEITQAEFNQYCNYKEFVKDLKTATTDLNGLYKTEHSRSGKKTQNNSDNVHAKRGA